MIFGRGGLQRFQEQLEGQAKLPVIQPILLGQIPDDAPTDDAAITVWNGERWMDYEQWRRSRPLAREVRSAESEPAIPEDAECVAGVCGEQSIWLIKDGDRWLMYLGSRSAGRRRRDFATPFLDHALRTAEAWYGAPRDGWRADAKKGSQAMKEEAQP